MYETFYKLNRRPFLLTADPGFFFNSRTHKKALAYLQYGLEQKEGFIVITGDVGTGKTTLVSYLLSQLENQNYATATIVSTRLKSDDLLRTVSAEFGLLYKEINKAHLIKNLNLFFQRCAMEGKRVLLIIDEAQNLPENTLEELRMLSNQQWKGKPLVQCYLLGQNQLRDRLKSGDLIQLRQRIIATYNLRSLDQQETEEYIKYRLTVAGWANDPEIDADVMKGIHAYTRGIPRLINLLCGRILLYGHLEELHRIDYQAFEQVLEDVKDEYWYENGADRLEHQDVAENSTDGK